jgi:hypothetical protein
MPLSPQQWETLVNYFQAAIDAGMNATSGEKSAEGFALACARELELI